jgi:hypothetical protein
VELLHDLGAGEADLRGHDPRLSLTTFEQQDGVARVSATDGARVGTLGVPLVAHGVASTRRAVARELASVFASVLPHRLPDGSTIAIGARWSVR